MAAKIEKSDYCIHCFHRDKPERNIPDFCGVGYTQNPNTLKATTNAKHAGAILCQNNPFYNKA